MLDAHRDDKIRCIVPLHRRLHPHGRCFQGHRRRLGPKTCPDDGTMAELACAQCLLQPCWLSAASAVDSTGLTQAEVGPQLQVNLPEPMCSGRAFVFQDSTCLCQARPKMCGSMPSEAKACCHTSRPRAWHRHVDPPSPPHFLFQDRCTRKKLLSQKVPGSVVQVRLNLFGLSFTGT